MTKLRVSLSALAATAVLTLASAAGAQSNAWPSPEELAQAFKTICVANAGDHAAQAKAAQAAPFNMKPGKASDAQTRYFDAFPWQVSLTTAEKGLKICAVTAGQDGSVTNAEASRAAIKVLGPRPGDIESIEDGFYWEPKIGGKEYTVMYQGQIYDNADGKLLIASYGLSW